MKLSSSNLGHVASW